MDALKHLAANIPDWQKRLEDLDHQIAKRQKELAQLAQASRKTDAGSTTAPRSIRNKGSTESLRPPDEPEAHPRDTTPQPDVLQPAVDRRPKSGNPAEPPSPTAAAQTNQARAAGQARARAILRKRQRSGSVVSAEGAPKFRTRSMIIVYYDSYVQVFFEDLVKFVSASRNMMRKAKMAAKVAQIKRLAELEMPSSSDEDEADKNNGAALAVDPSMTSDGAIVPLEPAPAIATADGAADLEPLHSLRFVSTRRMQPGGAASPGALLMAQSAFGRSLYSRNARGPHGRGGGPDLGPDIYDDLDKGLEYVQSMCEHAAHQFLRDGDCHEEVGNIARRMLETKELADKELERAQHEARAKTDEDKPPRSYRPPIMRRPGSPASRGEAHKEGAASTKVSSLKAPSEIEVDEGVEDMEADSLPKLVYKSTRMM